MHVIFSLCIAKHQFVYSSNTLNYYRVFASVTKYILTNNRAIIYRYSVFSIISIYAFGNFWAIIYIYSVVALVAHNYASDRSFV